MANVSKKDVKRLAALARIALSHAELQVITPELDAILDYVRQLESVDTKGLEPTSQITGLVDVWRADAVEPSPISREELLKNTPHTKDGYIKVKKVL